MITSPIPFKEKFAFGMGDFASTLIFATVTTFLMFYYTDIYGISAAAVGTLIFVARGVDAVWDVFLGTMVDRTKSRWGQCRPYLLFGAPVLGICAIAVFSAPAGSDSFKLVYAYTTYIALMMAYSLVNIPYGAMPALLTDDVRDRTKLAMIRTFCAYTCSILVNTTMLKLVSVLGGDNRQLGYQYAIILIAVASSLIFWFCFAGTKERVKPMAQEMHVKRDIGTLLGKRPWWVMAICCIFISMALTIVSGSTLYYLTYVVGDESRAPLFFLATGIGMVSGILLSSTLTRRYCKLRVMQAASILATLLYISFYFVDPQSSIQINGLTFFINLFGGCVYPIMVSMIPDVADDAELRSGRRMVGLTASTIAFAIKFGLGIGAVIAGLLLTYVGYRPNVPQTAEAIVGLKLIMSAVPAAGKLIVFTLLFFYPLHQKRLDEIQPLLRAARGAT